MAHADDAERFSIVRLCISALNLCVGFLFFIRDPVKLTGSVGANLASLPSLVIAGFALKLAAPLDQWAGWQLGLFVSGTFLAVFAFVTLGRSFALLPAVRKIMTHGPFRIIRHPAYAGEFLMILACGFSQFTPATAWPAMVILPLIVMRIYAEESTLKMDAAYQEYVERVQWRLLPKIW